MIDIKIPTSSRFIAPTQYFDAPFNLQLDGRYSFTGAYNQNRVLTELLPNTVYLIDSIDIGANISEEKFLDSIDVVPTLIFRRNIANEIIYRHPITICNYQRNGSVTAFVNCDQADELAATFTGYLTQTTDLIGITVIRLFVSLRMYAIEGTEYIKLFKNDPASVEKIRSLFLK